MRREHYTRQSSMLDWLPYCCCYHSSRDPVGLHIHTQRAQNAKFKKLMCVLLGVFSLGSRPSMFHVRFNYMYVLIMHRRQTFEC